jgi:hypothetical protein
VLHTHETLVRGLENYSSVVGGESGLVGVEDEVASEQPPGAALVGEGDLGEEGSGEGPLELAVVIAKVNTCLHIWGLL